MLTSMSWSYWIILLLATSLLTWKEVHGTSYTDSTSRINLARGKPTRQSSNYKSWGPPSKAVDGNTNTAFWGHSCTHTEKELNPWWRVDLQQEFVIDIVKITNRGDGLGYRMRGMSIYVGNDETAKENQVCVQDQSLFDGETREFSCSSNPKGKYVFVTLTQTKPNPNGGAREQTKAYLTLCEVQVFEIRKIDYGVNVALGKPADQSSIDERNKPSNALDKSLTTCAKTLTEENPWWRVDLIVSFDVASVKVIVCEGSSGLDTFQVIAGTVDNIDDISNTECKNSAQGSASEFLCPRYPTAQFVFIKSSETSALTLKNAEVFVAERVISGSGCEEKTIGGNGEVTNIEIPDKLLYTSTTIDHWGDNDIKVYEAFGTQVYMSEIIQSLTQLGHNPDDNPAKVYQFRIRADTFYCTKKGQLGGQPYKFHGFQKFEIIARKIISDGCEIEFTQVDPETVDDFFSNANAGSSGLSFGESGGKGGDGNDGVAGRGITVIMNYLESMGKITMKSKGGMGGNGSPGSSGGDGFKGKKGANAVRKPKKCGKVPGGDGGDGGNGGEGGRGGHGGNGGNGGQWIFLTPGNSESDIQFVLKGCPGDPGTGAKGGDGGKGKKGGIGGKGLNGYMEMPRDRPYKVCHSYTEGKGADGNDGSDGEQGANGENGEQGIPGVYVLKNLDQNMYDNEVAKLILRQADEHYMKGQSSEALQLYEFINHFAKVGKSKEYSKLMMDKIKAGFNYYGYTDKQIMAIDIAKSDTDVDSAMTAAREEDGRIDKNLYRASVDEKTTIQFEGLTKSLQENNEGIKRETDRNVQLWKIQRNNVVVEIADIEAIMKNLITDIKGKLEKAQTRHSIDTVLKFFEIGFSYAKPKLPDIEDIFQTVLEVGQEAVDCHHTYDYPTMTALMETAIQFSKFEGTTYNWDTMDLSKLRPQAAAEMSKVLTKDKIGALEETFNCLFQHGSEGDELSGAIGTYLDYALTRFTFIGEVYKIDTKLAELKIRLNSIEETNKNLRVLSDNTKSRTAEVILNRVAITEDLIQTFEETAKDVLTALYIQTESLRFITLWDFKKCMSFYIPNHLIKAERKSYFDGYRPLATLSERIKDYRKNYRGTLASKHSMEHSIENWIVEFKDVNSKAIKNLQMRKHAQVEIKESFFRSRGDTNFRLHKLYAELVFKPEKRPDMEQILLIIEHMGDNHFHDGSEDDLVLLTKAYQRKFTSRVTDQKLGSCSGQSCRGNASYADDIMKDICDVSPVKKIVKRTSSRRFVKVPCRSPFAKYKVMIPIGSENKPSSSYNPSSTDTSGVIGIRFLIGVSFWERYPKSKPGCQRA